MWTAAIALSGCVRTLWSIVCRGGVGVLDWQQESGWLVVPVVKAGCGRWWRVLSRQYEAYVRDQCWTAEITEMRRVEGQWGLRETGITRGLMPWPQAEWLLSAAHTRASLALPLPLSSRLQSRMLIRLSPSSEWSVHSFVSGITTEKIRAWPFNLFKHLSVCHWRKTALGVKVGQVDVLWWHGTQLARLCPPPPLYLTQNVFRYSNSITVGLDIKTRTRRNLVCFPHPTVNTIFN